MMPTRRGYVLLLQGTAKRSGETVIPLRKITNRDVAADEFGFAEAFVEHAVKAMGFLRVTLDAVAAVGFVFTVRSGSTGGALGQAAHLRHQPFQHRNLCSEVALGPKLTGFLAEVDQIAPVQMR
jgi:hypothetical protein